MKIRNYKTTDLTISVGAIIFVIGILIGAFTTSMVCQNEFSNIQEQLKVTQEELYIYQEAYKEAIANAQYEYEVNENLEMDLAEAMETVYDLKNEEYELVYMGDFKITYYCDERYSHICGGSGITASGKATEIGVTAAADWSVLPKGSIVYIESIGFREIQDVGGGVNGNHIDVLVRSHTEALSLGTHSEGVWVLLKKNT